MQPLAEPFRIVPKIGPQFYKTYGAYAPLSTHWRPASCEEYECGPYLNGWVTPVDLSTAIGQQQAHYIRTDTSRRCREEQTGPSQVRFVFGPGQRCFRSSEHRVPAGRPPLYVVSGGDWRGNPRGDRLVHRSVEDWVDDFANHQDKIAAAIGRG